MVVPNADSPQDLSENIPSVPSGGFAPVGKKKKKGWKIVGIVIGVLFFCSLLCIGLSLIGHSRVKIETEPLTSVLDSFMQQMVVKDADKAYELFSPRVQRQISKKEVENLLSGNNYVLFDGYQNMVLTTVKLTANVNTNQNLPQGAVATVNGVIDYEGDFSGKLDAVLEKVDGKWKIHVINITVPPDKIK